MVKNPPAHAGDLGSIPGSRRSPGGGNGNPLQNSCLENPMNRGAWWATVHRVAESQILVDCQSPVFERSPSSNEMAHLSTVSVGRETLQKSVPCDLEISKGRGKRGRVGRVQQILAVSSREGRDGHLTVSLLIKSRYAKTNTIL